MPLRPVRPWGQGGDTRGDAEGEAGPGAEASSSRIRYSDMRRGHHSPELV